MPLNANGLRFTAREGLHKWWRSSSFMLAGEGLRHFRAMFPTTWRLSSPLESVQRHYAPWVTSNLRRKINRLLNAQSVNT